MDFRDAVEDLLTEYPPSGLWARLPCPKCESDGGHAPREKNLSVQVDTGWFGCWRVSCGLVGRLQRDWAPPPIIWKEVAEAPPEIQLPPGFIRATNLMVATSPLFEEPREYLRSRRISPELAREVGIGLCITGRFAERIIVPILDENNKFVGFVGRDYTGRQALRYLNPKEMPRERILFNMSAISERTETSLMLVEGVFDALSYWPCAVAAIGKPTDSHLDLFAGLQRPLVVALDGDAKREGWAISERLKLKYPDKIIGYVELPAGQDPGSVNPEALWAEVELAAAEAEIQMRRRLQGGGGYG